MHDAGKGRKQGRDVRIGTLGKFTGAGRSCTYKLPLRGEVRATSVPLHMGVRFRREDLSVS